MINKIYAFIDSQNLNLGILDQGWRLDYKRFLVYLKEKYNVEKAFLFIGYIPTNQKLYDFLKRSGYKLIFKPTVLDGNGKAKGNVDAELVLYSVRIEYENYSKAIIISGDGDFQCLVKYLAKQNKLSKVLVPNQKKYSKLLSEYRKYLVFMNDLKGKLSYVEKGK